MCQNHSILKSKHCKRHLAIGRLLQETLYYLDSSSDSDSEFKKLIKRKKTFSEKVGTGCEIKKKLRNGTQSPLKGQYLN